MRTAETPFIADQEWSLLSDFQHPKRHLSAAQFRASRPGGSPVPVPPPTHGEPPNSADSRNPWESVTDADVVAILSGSWPSPAAPEESAAGTTTGKPAEENGDAASAGDGSRLRQVVESRPRRGKRMVITTDAGLGKTTSLEWLAYRLGLCPGGLLPLALSTTEWERLAQGELRSQVRGLVRKQLEMSCGADVATASQCEQLYEQCRRAGRLVLLCDGLDQASPAAIEGLKTLCLATDFANCPVVIGGRPYALQRHWSVLFDSQEWLFIRRERLTKEQQKAFLGIKRYEAIPEQAYLLLEVPRVLYYIGTKIAEAELPRLKSASHVYLRAIDYMIREGMSKGAEAARRLGVTGSTPDKPRQRSIDDAWTILGAIAWQMTTTLVRDSTAGSDASRSPLVPNFDKISAGQKFLEFQDALEQRYKSRAEGKLPQDLDALAALNEFLEQGFLDSDTPELTEIQFRNRSLQEFLCAYHLATDAFGKGVGAAVERSSVQQQADLDWLRQRLPVADQPATEDLFPLWEFLCEMPAEEPSVSTGRMVRGRVTDSWVQAISPLYQPARCENPEAAPKDRVYRGRRSSELLYRSWWGLQECCAAHEPSAIALRQKFHGQFQGILNGDEGPIRQAAAVALRDSFLHLPATTSFRMGSVPGKAKSDDPQYEQLAELWCKTAPEGRAEAAEQFVAKTYTFPPTKSGLAERARYVAAIRNSLESGLEAIEAARTPTDETPEQAEQPVAEFQLSRQPASNAWFRLYAPSHGDAASVWAREYKQFSSDWAQPAIYVSWFDAWAFAEWCHWQGKSCRLPFECEWEYAAKFDTNPEWNYWWGDRPIAEYFNGEYRERRTTSPSPTHANPKTQAREVDPTGVGLQDMLGNVWEWCLDIYRPAYRCHLEDQITKNPFVSRVLRGGAFNFDANFCRSAFRVHWPPANSDYSCGVRLARAE
jgi:formylglycine-generating enzyme required for sulfatase activity